MDIKHLAEFVALAESGNYLDAAENLFISQSTLSKHIMAVERELGVSLFERTTRRVKLSRNGEIFLPYAIKIVQLQSEYTNVLSAKAQASANKITIASTSQMVQYNVTDALAQYKRTHLSCQLNVLVEPHKNLKQLLHEEKADFIWIGETAAEAREKDYIRVPFLTEPLVVLVPKQHPLAAKGSVTVEDLRNQEIIMQDNSSVEQEVFVSLCQRHGFEPNIISIPGGKALADFVTHGVGVAVMLLTPALNVSDSDIAILNVVSSPLIRVSLLYMKGKKLSPTSISFLNFLRNQF